MSTYSEFLSRRRSPIRQAGPSVAAGDLHPFLHEWQAHLVAWAVRTGRAALWADTGLGKTVMQLEWARVVSQTTGLPVLVVAPLAVCRQTVEEASKLGIHAEYVRDWDPLAPDIMVTNYEMLPKFDPASFGGVVLDEASILKQSTGKTRTAIIEWARDLPFRLACTATPAPNDPEELTNQAEFLGRMRRVDMLASYFVHDDEGWRLKGHARQPMMRWMASWAVAIRRPSDLGWADEGYVLPGLELIPHLVPTTVEADGQLFATDLGGVGGRAAIRKQTLAARCELAAALVEDDPNEPWLLWAGLNEEADTLARLTGAVNVHGGMSPEEKAEALLAFSHGEIQRLVTKPSIASLGLNWQRCARMAFVGLSDSYEAYYQAIRRCYRYGQTRVVHAHVVLSEIESAIWTNVLRKERAAGEVTAALVEAMASVHLDRKDIA